MPAQRRKPSNLRRHRRAAPYQRVEPRAQLARAIESFRAEVRGEQALEQRHILRGLLVLALVALVFALWRAGADRVFPTGWLW